MPRQKIPFIQGEAPDNAYPINMFFLPNFFNGRDAMVGTPGLITRVDPTYPHPARNMKTDKDREYLYAVIGNTLYLIDSNWTFNAATTQLDTSTGFVWMKPNLTQMMIVDGVSGYIVTRSGNIPTVTKIIDPDFVVPSSLTMQDNYFIVSQKNSFNFQLSALSDGFTWDPLDIGTAEGNPDNILVAVSDHRQLFMLGHKSGEIFYNSSAITFPFERYPDVFIENGLGAPASVFKTDNSIYYLDENFLIRRLEGFVPKIVSPPQLNQIFTTIETKSDAICFSYVRQGNIFYVINLPTANKTYVYNIATGFVHQWASEVSQNRHRANCYEYFNGKDLVGDHSNGKIYSLEDNVYTDAGETIKWTYISPQYHESSRMLFFKELDLDFKTGVGIQSGQGSDPQIMLRYSDDERRTWSNEHTIPLGKQGEYTNRVIKTRLGGSRNRCFEISGTDPVERTFSEVNMDIELGR